MRENCANLTKSTEENKMILIVALSILQKQDPEQLVIQYGTDFGVRVNRLSRKRLDNR